MEAIPISEKREARESRRPAIGKAKPGRKRPKRPRGELVDYRQMKALSKEERVKIFAIFCERVASPKEISEELNEGLSQVSYHVNVLRECRLIVADHKVPRRGAVEHFYRAAEPTLIPPNAWNNLPSAVRKSISLAILQEFFEDASASIATGIFDDRPGELSWMPLILDKLGVDEFGQLSQDFVKSVLDLQAKATKRLSNANGRAAASTTATIFLASFLSTRKARDGKRASATLRR